MFFAVMLLVLSIALKFGLDFLTAKQQVVISGLQKQIVQEKNNFPIENQKAIVDFQRGVRNVKSILLTKISSSSFLANIADNTHKEIYFNYLTSSSREKSIEIGGMAKSNEALVQAIEALKGIRGVSSVAIKSTRNDSTGVTFILSMDVNESFFR